MTEQPDWELINAKKRMDILRGQALNFAWTYAMSFDRTLGEKIKIYKEVFPLIFMANTELANAKKVGD